MRKTIKQLESEIEKLEEAKSNWYNKYTDLKVVIDQNKRDEMMSIKSERKELSNQVINLMEIIRWHLNPHTAESPFMPTKSEIDELSKITN